MKFLQLAENLGVSKFVSVQNPYSLLNRTYEIGMSEIAKYEGVGLLAYSPLAFGYLTGKFRNGARPANARVTLFLALADTAIRKVNGQLNNMHSLLKSMV